MRWMHLRLEAPLASFGGEMIDTRGIIQDFPAQSMLAGLFANALGWTRSMTAEHQRLQERVVFGAAHDSDFAGAKMTDYQTAQLRSGDRAWSTRGYPIGRAGGSGTYKGAHQRWRDYHTDLRMSLVVCLMPDEEEPTMDILATALQRPARPLFIGRKPCLPTAPIFCDWLEGADVLEALKKAVPEGRECPALWPRTAEMDGERATMITDERNWISGLHGGARKVCLGRLTGIGESQ